MTSRSALNRLRSDLHFYPVPFDKLVAPVCPEAKLRKLVRNMIYDGVVAHLLGIDLEEMQQGAVQAVRRPESQSRRAELGRGTGRQGIRREEPRQDRSIPRRAHERDRGQDHHRRQLGRGARLRVRRGDGAYLVSDHAFFVSGRSADRLPETFPHGSGNGQGNVSPSFRRRMNSHPSAW